MIQNILKENGIEAHHKIIGHEYPYSIIKVFIKEKEYVETLHIKHNTVILAIEKACCNYVIEEGFKFEWLSDKLKDEINYEFTGKFTKTMVQDLFREIIHPIYSYHLRIVAWLYANNVEIKK